MLHNSSITMLTVFILSLGVRLWVLYYSNIIFDDAFILMRVARNLSEGLGLVFNVGERVQAVTSPLYTLIVGALWYLFEDSAILISQVIGVLTDSCAAVLIAALIIGKPEIINQGTPRSLDRHIGAFIGGGLYGLISTTVYVAPAGLETGFYTFTIVFTFYAFQKGFMKLSAVFAGGAFLIRPDGIILAGLFIILLLYYDKVSWKEPIIIILIIIVYNALLYFYYGSVIPQTVIAKSLLIRSPSLEWISFIRKFFLQWVSIPFSILFLFGIYITIHKKDVYFIVLLWGILYVSIFSTFGMWWSWYFPPVVAWYSILIGLGVIKVLNIIKKYNILLSRFAHGIFLIIPIIILGKTIINAEPFSDYMGPYLQQRMDVAKGINILVKDNDIVMIEPLGIVGYYANRHRFYDYPGLVSPVVSTALKDLGRKIPGKPIDPEIMRHLITRVRPECFVLREDEYISLKTHHVVDNYYIAGYYPIGKNITFQHPDLQPMYLICNK